MTNLTQEPDDNPLVENSPTVDAMQPGLAQFLKFSVLTTWIDNETDPCDHFGLSDIFTSEDLFSLLEQRLGSELDGRCVSHVLVRRIGGWQVDELPEIVPVRRGGQRSGWEDLTVTMCANGGPSGIRMTATLRLKAS